MDNLGQSSMITTNVTLTARTNEAIEAAYLALHRNKEDLVEPSMV